MLRSILTAALYALILCAVIYCVANGGCEMKTKNERKIQCRAD